MINFTRIVAVSMIVLAVALGSYAWWLGSRPAAPPRGAGEAASTPVQASIATFPVVVTSRAVPAGESLTAAALRIAQLPVNPPDALHDLPAAIGQVPVNDLGEGTPVMKSQLVSGLALRVAEGERAVAVKVNEVTGVANQVRPGDFVDVFVVLRTDGREIEQSQARLLLSRQRGLTFGAASIDAPPPGADGSAGSAPAPRSEAARTAVLAVPVEDVSTLVLGEASGSLLLALRRPDDPGVPDVALFPPLPGALKTLAVPADRATLAPIDRARAGIATVDLASGGAPGRTRPVVAAAAAAPAFAATALAPVRRAGPSDGRSARGRSSEVEIIRGDKRETVSY